MNAFRHITALRHKKECASAHSRAERGRLRQITSSCTDRSGNEEAHPAGGFCRIGDAVSYTIKNPGIFHISRDEFPIQNPRYHPLLSTVLFAHLLHSHDLTRHSRISLPHLLFDKHTCKSFIRYLYHPAACVFQMSNVSTDLLRSVPAIFSFKQRSQSVTLYSCRHLKMGVSFPAFSL